jgi:nucleotide-binding universal stress UspA family protein
MAATPRSLSSTTDPSSVFTHVLVGVDGTAAGLEACREAGVLVEPEGSLELVFVADTGLAVHAGMSAPRILDEMEQEAANAFAAAAEIAGGRASTRLIRGTPTTALLGESEKTGATLVVVGSHHHSRFAEMVLGGVSGEVLHRSLCSVLVARSSAADTPFPRSLLVGIDGSEQAERALAVGRYLATRFGVPLRTVTALRDTDLDLDLIHRQAPSVEEIDERPVEALRAASLDVDLLIVGSRGLHGVRALGSVSERIAHVAACSVLVVREPKR